MIWIAIGLGISTIILLLVFICWLAGNLDGFGEDSY